MYFFFRTITRFSTQKFNFFTIKAEIASLEYETRANFSTSLLVCFIHLLISCLFCIIYFTLQTHGGMKFRFIYFKRFERLSSQFTSRSSNFQQKFRWIFCFCATPAGALKQLFSAYLAVYFYYYYWLNIFEMND